MNRKDLVKKAFPKEYEKAITVKDPSGSDKYLYWVATQVKRGHNTSDIAGTIDFFHRNRQRFDQRDIHQYKDLKELEDIVKSMTLSNSEVRNQMKSGAEKIHENEHVTLYKIHDKNAIMFYGANTKWCVISQDTEYFEEYSDSGNVFYVIVIKNKSISKEVKSTKWAIVKDEDNDVEIFDEKDNSWSVLSFTNKHYILKEAYMHAFLDEGESEFQKVLKKSRKSISKEHKKWILSQPASTLQHFIKEGINSSELMKDVNVIKKLIDNNFFKRGYSFYSYMDEFISDSSDNNKKEIINYIFDNNKINNVDEQILWKFFPVMSEKQILLFKNHNDPSVKAAIVKKIDKALVYSFLDDKNEEVYRAALSRLDISELFELRKKKRGKNRDLINYHIFKNSEFNSIQNIINNLSEKNFEKLVKGKLK